MKAANVINRGFNLAKDIRVIWIKCCNEWQDIFIWLFLGFYKSFCGIAGAFWIPCFISESLSWYFHKFDFKFPKFCNFSAIFSVTVQIVCAKHDRMFRWQCLGYAKVNIFVCIWVYRKRPPKLFHFRFFLLKHLDMVFGPYYIP